MQDHIDYLRRHATRQSHSVRPRILEAASTMILAERELVDLRAVKAHHLALVEKLRLAWEAAQKPDDSGERNYRGSYSIGSSNVYFDADKTPDRMLLGLNEAVAERSKAVERQQRLETCIKALHTLADAGSLRTAIEAVAMIENIALNTDTST